MFAYFLKMRASHLGRALKSARAGQLVTALLFLLVVALVAFVVYAFLYNGFSFIAENEYLRVALPLFIYELFLLVVSVLVFASALITGLFSLFQNSSDFWILKSPSYASILADKFTTIFLESLWPLFIIVLPAIFAIGTVFGIGILGFLLALVSVVLLGVVVTALALLLILCAGFFARFMGRVFGRGGGFGTLLALVTVVFLGLLFFLLRQFSGMDVSALFTITNLDLAQAKTGAISARFFGLPSDLAAGVFSAVQIGATAVALKGVYFLTLFAVLLSGLYFSFSRGFLSLWQHFRAGAFQARTKAGVKSARAKTRLFSGGFSGGPTRAVLAKEAISLVRDSRSVFWFGFLTLLWVLVTGFDVFIQESFKDISLGALSAPELVQVLQLLVIVYFIASLVLRFVFPSFSSERDTGWVMFSSPIGLRRVFFAKAVFSSVILGILTLIIGFIHINILEGSLGSASLFLFFALGEAIVLSLCGLSYGVIFPNFETTDPQKLSTTLSGLSFTGGALVYGALAAYVYYLTIGFGLWWTTALFVSFSLALVSALTLLALRRLPTLEFTTTLES